jgi:hypothetical protein
MRPTRYFLVLTVLACFSCEEISPLEETNVTHVVDLVNVTDSTPFLDVRVNGELFYPNEEVTLTAYVSDLENDPVDVAWVIAGDTVSRDKTFEFTSEEGRAHKIKCVARDPGGNSIEERIELEIKDYPNILVRLNSISGQGHVGDSYNDEGELYFIIHSVSSAVNTASQDGIQQYVYPGSPDQVDPYTLHPFSSISFGPNSGLVIYQGRVEEFWGFAMTIHDHDPQGFDFFGFFGDIFDFAGDVLGTVAPQFTFITEGLGELNNIIDEHVQDEAEDDTVASFVKLYTQDYRWGTQLGEIYAEYNGVTISYSIEFVD